MKDLLLVFIGSGIGGGLRFIVSKAMTALVSTPFPVGTFTVNIAGCLLIGFFSAVPATQNWLSPSTRLLLTTGFCGGFTTFSTFMKEGDGLLSQQMPLTFIAYIALSIVLGMIAVWAGYKIGGMTPTL